MATFIVTTAADGGAGSLRAAIAQANATAGADTITFDAAVFNGQAADIIRLTTGALAVTDTLTIEGGAAGVTITGDALGNDVTDTKGITDVAASQAGPDRLADNTRILDAGFATALTLRHLTLTGGHTGGYNDPGGAVRAGELTIIDSTLAGNSTAGGVSFGGAAFNNGTASLTNVTLSGNVTTGTQAAGGGIYTAGALTLTNSTVTGNSTAGAGAIGGGAYGSQLTLVNSIVLGNATTAAGTGGDEVAGGFSGPLTLVGGNIIGKGGGAADIFAGATDSGDTTAAAVFAATTAGPGGTLAGVLADNGGPVETVALKADPANPAIDAGTGGSVAADARGAAAVDVPGIGASGAGAAVRDLGAFEADRVPEAASLVVTTAADVVDAFDTLTSLREAVAYAEAKAGGDTITFDQAVFNGEAQDIIRLTHGQITINEGLVIDGGPNGVLITGDALGDDVTYAGGVTDVAASLAGEDRLDDNTRIFDGFNALSVTLQRLTLTGGRTTGEREGGGAITVLGELRLIDSTLAGNSTTGDYATGGAAKASNIVMTNATLVGNSTTGDAAGGGGAYAGNQLTAINSTVTGNSTAGVGILTPSGSVNGLLHFTYSAAGGGLSGGVLEIGGSIVTGNATFGAGVGNENIGYFRSADIAYYVAQLGKNAIVPLLGRAVAIGPDLVGYQAGSLLLSGTSRDSIADANLPFLARGRPIFAAADIFDATTTLPNGTVAGVLADNGGAVRTVALRASSVNPAIDRVDDTPADARGTAAFDALGQGGGTDAARDLGAFEITGPASPPLIVTTAADIVDGFDGVTSLREAVFYANRHAGDNTITFDPTVFDGSAGATIRLTQGAIAIGIFNTTQRLTIDGGPAGVMITGDALDNDVTDARGITDVMASIAGTNRLADNSRIFENGVGSYGSVETGLTTLANLTLTGGYAGRDLGGTRAGFGGGAVAVGLLALVDSTVAGNATGGDFSLFGGGVAAFKLSLLRSTVANNRTLAETSDGGGVFSQYLLTMTDSTVSGNAALGAGARGGGIRSLNLNLTPDVITNSTIADNHLLNTGGYGGVLGVNGSGGGISGYRMTLVNSTVTGNTAASGLGGGIFAARPLTLSNSIVMGNQTLTAGLGGDNIQLRADLGPIVPGTLIRTGRNIIGNDSGTGDIYQGATDVGDTTAAAVFAQTLVLAGGTVAGVAADNGGPTHTVALLLDPANPAIGSADPATATDTDQRGETRDAKPDLGAFELENPAPVAVADSAGTGRDSGIVLNILGNDDDMVGGIDPTSVRLVGADAGSDGRSLTVAGVGTWLVDATSGAVTFTPSPGFQGPATASYTVADAYGLLSAPTAISIDVAPGASGTATSGRDRLLGSLYGDSMDGLAGHDRLLGLGGADTLQGGDGNDTIEGGLDADSIAGGAGDDVFLIRGGIQSRDDSIDGGTGFDTVRVVPGVAAVVLTTTAWTGVEAFDGSGAKVVGTVIGDTLDFSGFASVTGIAVVIGGAGDDTLAGGSGADSLMGSIGDDRLTGGAGNDTMAGGAGQDRFVFGPGFGEDRILDFDANPAGGQDLLVLQGFGPAPALGIAVEGTDTRVTIGADSVLLVGVTGLGARVVTMDDIVIL